MQHGTGRFALRGRSRRAVKAGGQR